MQVTMIFFKSSLQIFATFPGGLCKFTSCIFLIEQFECKILQFCCVFWATIICLELMHSKTSIPAITTLHCDYIVTTTFAIILSLMQWPHVTQDNYCLSSHVEIWLYILLMHPSCNYVLSTWVRDMSEKKFTSVCVATNCCYSYTHFRNKLQTYFLQ